MGHWSRCTDPCDPSRNMTHWPVDLLCWSSSPSRYNLATYVTKRFFLIIQQHQTADGTEWLYCSCAIKKILLGHLNPFPRLLLQCNVLHNKASSYVYLHHWRSKSRRLRKLVGLKPTRGKMTSNPGVGTWVTVVYGIGVRKFFCQKRTHFCSSQWRYRQRLKRCFMCCFDPFWT